ncbi:MAG: hypothetical protein IT582_11220 [Opitutaceae bacterium]|nr:hypothetical protein [Opitutaceae bacterium]
MRDAPFAHGQNALCWPRGLPGDFTEIVTTLGPGEGVAQLDEARLLSLKLSQAGQRAREGLLNDLRLLRDQGLAPELNCIYAYPHDQKPIVYATDVYSWHADSAPFETATWLCTYHGAPSEGLPNTQARRQSDDPVLRDALLREYGGADDAGFAEFLREHGHDLHYATLHGAQPWSFGCGNMWRIAVDWPGSPVPPCIHRAPAQGPGSPPRLLLIC